MDIVYVVGTGSKWGDAELMHSLRSICKFTNHRNVYIVGHKPNFVEGVIHLPVKDVIRKEYSIMNKILEVCKEEDLSDDFLFMNDDHFFIKEVDIENYPYYHQDALNVEIQKRLRGPYRTEIERTYEYLKDKVKSPKYYDIHTPIIYNKYDFPTIIKKTPLDRYDMVIKSLYANMKGVVGTYRKDIKLLGSEYEKIKGVDCFSVGDRCNYRVLKRYLDQFYGEPCRYEKKA